jgi:secreted PhoX family phosphatase
LTDMLTFFPADNPTHLITCVEGGREVINEDGKLNPSVQRIHLSTGQVHTILRGMERCDGIRTTPWGTILATEETEDGGVYEILDPLATTEQRVLDRATGQVSGPNHIAKRPALPR